MQKKLIDKLIEKCTENVEEVKVTGTHSQKIIELLSLKKGEVKQITIKSRIYYFHNDMMNLKHFDSNLLKIDKKHYKGINAYYIG